MKWKHKFKAKKGGMNNFSMLKKCMTMNFFNE